MWAKIGLLGFGGPAGQIALTHKELVEDRKWIDDERFLHALNYCMLLPGPEAQQLATYIGWLMHKTRGGLIAGTLFVLPGFAAILTLSLLYAGLRDLPAVSALFFGLKAAVLSVVVEAVLRIGKRALKSPFYVVIAGLSFVGICFFDVPFPLVVLLAGILGVLGHRVLPAALQPVRGGHGVASPLTVIGRLSADGHLNHTSPSTIRTLRVLVVCGLAWGAPLALLALTFGRHSIFVQEGVLFSKAAVVTFGGAYAVLAYIAQRAVDSFGWLEPGEMLDGLGLAETTPGPLILVVQFVGFMAAYRNPSELSPMVAGLIGSCVTVWVTFVPCFLWIFLGAPYIESLRGNRTLNAALSAITAAVVGVILNLSLWFALHVVFRTVSERHIGPLRILVPSFATFDAAAIALAAIAMLATFRWKLGLPKTLALTAGLGLLWQLAVPPTSTAPSRVGLGRAVTSGCAPAESPGLFVLRHDVTA